MASTVMATRPIALLARSSSSPSLPSRKLSVRAQQSNPSPSFTIPNLKRLLSVPPVAMLAAAATPLPALAEAMEKAALFEFNLTLPIIAIEFLLLMVALDKLYFSPLGKFMDERDAKIRSELGEVKDTSTEVKRLEDEANAIMRAARAEVAAALNKMKKEITAELEQQLADEQAKMEAELQDALANLEKEKEEAIRILDAQIDVLSEEVVRKVVPQTS